MGGRDEEDIDTLREEVSSAARAEELGPDRETVFPQSVASGDPTAADAILWTRVEPDVYDPSNLLVVDVAADESFVDSQRTFVRGEELTAEHDHTIKVNLDVSDVELDPDNQYYFRFIYDGTRSRTGTFRTLPAEDARPKSLRFAVVTCQDYLYGNFGAYHHIAESDLDFILDLGDFIYEYAKRRSGSRTYPGRDIEFPSGEEKTTTLKDYRYLLPEVPLGPSPPTRARTARSDLHVGRPRVRQ